MICEFRIDGLPTSYNKAFQIIWGLKECHLSPEAHAYKNRVKMSVPATEEITGTLRIDIAYHYDFYYKNGKLKKIDTSNCDKLLIDAICERLGCDDSIIKERQVKDYHNDKEEYVIVKIDKL
jgi:hypothetical protein